MNISKSDFLKYLECESHFWYLKNKPEVLTPIEIDEFTQNLIDQGEVVEEYARKRFPDGKLVLGRDMVAATQQMLTLGQRTLFQASFAVDGLYARVDILDYNDLLGGWDLYEIKSTVAALPGKKKKKNTHMEDATFQKIVLDRCGMKIANVYLVEMNKEYVKEGPLDLEAVFAISEITTEVLNLEQLISTQIGDAKILLQHPAEPKTCGCIRKPRKHHCPAFAYIYPNIPAYGVHDLSRIGNKKKLLSQFVYEDIYALEDIRDDHNLSTIQRNQWHAQVNDIIIDKREEMNATLEELPYPLYFLDYETIAEAIPRFDKSCPHQQVPIQYSIHIQEDKHSDYIHREYLYDMDGCPYESISKKLREDIGDQGTIIVWYKGFECSRTKELAIAVPELADFLLGINERTFDLMELFSKQKYVHKDFRGSASIKAVLPVVCPELSYKNLGIQNGGAATTKFKELITYNYSESDANAIKQDLLAYCKLDTWAMVRIFEEMSKKRADRTIARKSILKIVA